MRRLGQFLSLLLLLSAGVLWVAQSSSAKDTGTVTIRTTDDGPKKVKLADLTPLEKEKYTVRDADGNKSSVTINKQHVGYSLASVYDAAGVDYEDVDFVEIARPDGGFVRLYGKQLGPNYWDDGPVAIYYDKHGTLSFIRPLYDGVENDVNAGDNFQLDGSLVVRDRTGTILDVAVTATPEKPEAGEAVSFTAKVEGGEGLELKYDWTFSDGKSSEEGATVSHAFDTPKAPASATVIVSTDHDDSRGEGSIAIGVGKEPKPEDTSDSGGYSGYDGYDSGYSGYSSGYSTPSYTSPGTDYSTPDSSPEATPSKPEKEPEVTQTEPTGTPVEGELLQDAAVVEGTSAPPSDSSSNQPEPTTPVSTVEQERSVPSSVVTGMAVIGLLGFGAFTELGGAGSRRPGRWRRLIPFGRGKN